MDANLETTQLSIYNSIYNSTQQECHSSFVWLFIGIHDYYISHISAYLYVDSFDIEIKTLSDYFIFSIRLYKATAEHVSCNILTKFQQYHSIFQ